MIEYHHIEPPSSKIEDIMLLCPECHALVTNGSISKEQQREYQASPYNIANDNAKGYLCYPHSELQVLVGTNTYVGSGKVLEVCGESLLEIQLDDGTISINAVLYDKDDNLLCRISGNEWERGSYKLWDIEFIGGKLTIRKQKGQISLQVDTRKVPIKIKGYFWKNGVLTRITDTKLNIPGITMTGCVFEDVGYMISIK